MQNKNANSLFGIDINEYTQNVQFNVLATKIDFLYLRSSGSGTGRFRVDRSFLEYARQARAYGIPVGAYHFGVPSSDLTDADRQCDDFINILQEGFGDKDYGDLFPVIDIETPVDNSISTETLVNWVDRFRKRFEKKTRRTLMLYTGSFFISLYNNFYVPGKGYLLKTMPLWIAMYTKLAGNSPFPEDQGGWKNWRVWQFSEDLNVEGVGNPVDANWGPNNIELLTQPSIVTGLKAVREKSGILITWNRIPDIDLLGYNIFIDNYWVGTVDEDATKFFSKKSKLNVKKGSKITITIEAFDYDGEVSKRRAKVVL
ncbi:MAG: glycoside hydrolase family 25 protein [Clostridium sp.]|nr:glycoside hydrolase family 25 protein [Clostridium sp.]